MSNIFLDFHGNRGTAVSVPPSRRRRQGRIHPIVNTRITKTVTNPFLQRPFLFAFSECIATSQPEVA